MDTYIAIGAPQYGSPGGVRVGDRGPGRRPGTDFMTSLNAGDDAPGDTAHDSVRSARQPGTRSQSSRAPSPRTIPATHPRDGVDPATPGAPTNCHAVVTAAGTNALIEVTWRHGTQTGPANPRHRDEVLIRRHPSPPPTTPLSRPMSAPCPPPIAELVRLAKIRWRIEHDYHELR